MKKIFLLIFTILLLYSEGFSQEDYAGDWLLAFQSELGKRPAAIFHDQYSNGYFTKWFVYCAGYDENHNGILDEGDEAPSLWAFSIEIPALSSMDVPVLATVHFNGWLQYTDPVKIMDFDFEDVDLPVRLAWAPNSQDGIYKFYLPESNKLIEVTVNFIQSHISSEMEVSSTKEILLDEPVNYVSIIFDSKNNGRLFLSKRNVSDNTGEVILYNLNTHEIDTTLPAGAGVQMIYPYSYGEFLVLNERVNDDIKGSLMNYTYVLLPNQEHEFQITSEVELPNSPTYIDFSQDYRVLVTSRDSEIMQFYSIINGKLDYVEDIVIENDAQMRQTKSELVYINSNNDLRHYYVASYSGYVYERYEEYSKNTKNMKLKAYGQAECLEHNLLNTQLVIATPYDESGEVSNNLTVYAKLPTSVNDDNTNNDIIVYPNPASDFITIKEESLINHYEIYSVLGDKIMISESNTIDISKLAKGMYYIKSNYKFYPFVKK